MPEKLYIDADGAQHTIRWDYGTPEPDDTQAAHLVRASKIADGPTPPANPFLLPSSPLYSGATTGATQDSQKNVVPPTVAPAKPKPAPKPKPPTKAELQEGGKFGFDTLLAPENNPFLDKPAKPAPTFADAASFLATHPAQQPFTLPRYTPAQLDALHADKFLSPNAPYNGVKDTQIQMRNARPEQWAALTKGLAPPTARALLADAKAYQAQQAASFAAQQKAVGDKADANAGQSWFQQFARSVLGKTDPLGAFDEAQGGPQIPALLGDAADRAATSLYTGLPLAKSTPGGLLSPVQARREGATGTFLGRVAQNVSNMTKPSDIPAFFATDGLLRGLPPGLGQYTLPAMAGFQIGQQAPQAVADAKAGNYQPLAADAATLAGTFALPHALGKGFEAAKAGIEAPVAKRVVQAAKMSMEAPRTAPPMLSADPFGLGVYSAADAMQRYRAAWEKTGQTPPIIPRFAGLESTLKADGTPEQFTVNGKYDHAAPGLVARQSVKDARQARSQAANPVESVQHAEGDSGVDQAMLPQYDKNGVLIASARGPVSSLLSKAAERENPKMLFSTGGQMMAASNAESATRAHTETKFLLDTRSTTKTAVSGAIADTANAYNQRMRNLVASGAIKTFTPADPKMSFDDFLPWMKSIPFNQRDKTLRTFSSLRNSREGTTPYYRDIVKNGNDPSLAANRPGSVVAVGTLDEGGKPLTASEAGLPSAATSYDTFGKGYYDGRLQSAVHWQDLNVVDPTGKGAMARAAQAKGDQQTFFRLNPQVELPPSYYEKNHGVKPREISAQGVYNGFGDGTFGIGQRTAAPVSGSDGTIPPSGTDAGRGGVIGGGVGNDTGAPNGSGLDNGANQRPAGNAALPLVGDSHASDPEVGALNQRIIKGGNAAPGRISGDVPTGRAYNRDPNPTGGRGGLNGGELPDAPRTTTGAVDPQAAQTTPPTFTPNPDAEQRIASAEAAFARHNPAFPDNAPENRGMTGQSHRQQASNTLRKIAHDYPGYLQERSAAGTKIDRNPTAPENRRPVLSPNEMVAQQNAAAGKTTTAPDSQAGLFGDDTPAKTTKPGAPYPDKVDPANVKVLPGMQYKSGTNRDAVTDQFLDENDFKMERAGRGTVYRDASGQDYAVDMHHRLELFNRAKTHTTGLPDGTRVPATDKRLDVQVLDAKDGWTPETAKRWGVVQNLGENKGEPLDAANALVGKGTPEEVDKARQDVQTLQKGELKRDVSGLIELDRQGRELVQNGKVDKSVAAAIGKTLAGDTERQKIALGQAQKTKGVTKYDDAVRLATTVLYEPVTATPDSSQGGLFDDYADAGYKSTAGTQTTLEKTVRNALAVEKNDLLRPTGANLREGENIDVEGRKTDAATLDAARSKADLLFSIDPEVRKALRSAALAVDGGTTTEAEAAALVKSVVQERGALSQADIVQAGKDSGQQTRPAPLPIRQRVTAESQGQNPPTSTPQTAQATTPAQPETAQERLQRLAAQASAQNTATPTGQTDTVPTTAGANGQVQADILPPGQTAQERLAELANQAATKNPTSANPQPVDASLARQTGGQIAADLPSKSATPEARKKTWLENASTIIKAGLLTGPATHLRNIADNTAMQISEAQSKPMAALADIVRVAAANAAGGQGTALGRTLGTERTTGGLSLPAVARSVRQGLTLKSAEGGLAQARELIKSGVVKNDIFERAGSTEEALGHNQEFVSKSPLLNAYVNGVFRSLSAEDRVYRVYAYSMSLEEQAGLIASAEKAPNRAARIKELTSQPTDAMQAQAISDAEVATFNNDNKLASAVSKFKNEIGTPGQIGGFGLDRLFPFVKTPSNVIARTLEYAGGTVYAPAKAGLQIAADLKNESNYARARQAFDTTKSEPSKIALQEAAVKLAQKNFTPDQQRAFAQTFGRGSLGSGLIMLGYTLASNGYMTGRNTKDSDYKRREGEGQPEAAMYVGGRWVVIPGPAGAMMTIGATIREQQGRDTPPGAGLLGAVANQVNDIPIMSGSDQIRGLADPSKLGRLFGSTAGQVVPTFAANAATQIDPSKRKQANPFDPLVARVPLARQTLPENGDRVTSPFDPFKSRRADGPANPDLFAPRGGGGGRKSNGETHIPGLPDGNREMRIPGLPSGDKEMRVPGLPAN